MFARSARQILATSLRVRGAGGIFKELMPSVRRGGAISDGSIGSTLAAGTWLLSLH